MKRMIAMLLVCCVILSGFTALSAAPTEEQWKDLADYRIMVGDPSGELREQDGITRAEAVKMICASMGMTGAAQGLPTAFKDVPETHWAAGYIALAAQMGIVQGDENGLFAPNAQITNEEMLKMIVVALGYAPMADMRGGYPAGYTMLGTSLGLTADMTLQTNVTALRSDAALMMVRALDIPLMKQVGFGSTVEYAIMNGENGVELQTLRMLLQ